MKHAAVATNASQNVDEWWWHCRTCTVVLVLFWRKCLLTGGWREWNGAHVSRPLVFRKLRYQSYQSLKALSFANEVGWKFGPVRRRPIASTPSSAVLLGFRLGTHQGSRTEPYTFKLKLRHVLYFGFWCPYALAEGIFASLGAGHPCWRIYLLWARQGLRDWQDTRRYHDREGADQAPIEAHQHTR